jgi:serine/threonine protein kinase
VQISDFGLAVTSGNLDKGSMELSGTLGYVAPEYLLDGTSFFSSHPIHISIDKTFVNNKFRFHYVAIYKWCRFQGSSLRRAMYTHLA